MRRDPRSWLTGCVALALLACSGGAGETADGPLRASTEKVHSCLPTRQPGAAVSYGGDVLKVAGTDTVVVESLRLVNPDNLVLRGSHLMAVHQGDRLIGGDPHYPPRTAGRVGSASEWKNFVRADGAALKPAGRGYAVLIGLSSPGSGAGRATGMEVRYRVGDRHYLVRIPTEITLKPGRSC